MITIIKTNDRYTVGVNGIRGTQISNMSFAIAFKYIVDLNNRGFKIDDTARSVYNQMVYSKMNQAFRLHY